MIATICFHDMPPYGSYFQKTKLVTFSYLLTVHTHPQPISDQQARTRNQNFEIIALKGNLTIYVGKWN